MVHLVGQDDNVGKSSKQYYEQIRESRGTTVERGTRKKNCSEGWCDACPIILSAIFSVLNDLFAQELPKVETALQKSIAELEEKSGEPFVYDGRPLLEIIAEYWEKRRVEKENEKESRVSSVMYLIIFFCDSCFSSNIPLLLQKTQSRTPLKPNSATHTPASSLMKRGKILGAVENFSARKPVAARRELQVCSRQWPFTSGPAHEVIPENFIFLLADANKYEKRDPPQVKVARLQISRRGRESGARFAGRARFCWLILRISGNTRTIN